MKKQLLLLLLGCSLGLFTMAQNITKVEYFIDADPGFGNATPVSFTASANATASFSPNITSLSEGTHRLYVRSADANGNWGITNTRVFYKTNAVNVANIVRVEYFIDIDPGFGNGISVPITASTDVATSFSPNITALPVGIHRLYIRSLNANGNWGVTNSRVFYKASLPTLANIVKLEYFVDTDPGFGNGTNIPITAATNIAGVAFTVNTASLTIASHRLYVRSLDANGNWCITNVSVFTKTQALPVNLLSFTATQQSNSIVTNWQTTNEVNVSHFTVQRSTNGSNFTDIGNVTATGGGNYSYADNNLPTTPTIYYRLKIVDTDGSFTYSKVVAVTINSKLQSLNVFPNPVKETLFAQLTSTKAEKVTVQITDMQGKILQQQAIQVGVGNTSISINTSALAKGSYILLVKGAELQQQKQFIKE